MKRKFVDTLDAIVYYVEKHMGALAFLAFFLIGLIRGIAYLVEIIRRCFKK